MNVRSAPTPSPEELQELKKIDKTFPERLITMAEKEQSFRHKSTFIGQIGFIVTVLGGYSLSAYVGTFSWQVGVAIAIGVSYIAYAFKNPTPKPPKS